jgi:hypothetical protein
MRGEISEKRVENKSGSIILATSIFTQSSQLFKEEEKQNINDHLCFDGGLRQTNRFR